jgi:adenine-specific DNA-methyltransferase
LKEQESITAHASQIDVSRLEANGKLDPTSKAELGQFMTPSVIADYMAGLFADSATPAKLLDCGAGIGSLTLAAAKKLRSLAAVEVWEVDPVMLSYLKNNIKGLDGSTVIHASDFIADSVVNIGTDRGTRFTHAILNPPYKKMGSTTAHRLLLRKLGIEAVNLYAAFLALTILLMEKGGQIVAIVPRSFCNGTYYKPFRAHILRHCSIKHIHVFESRTNAFSDDQVLQENIIIKLVRGEPQGKVCISTSHDQSMRDYKERSIPFSEVVLPGDEELFIHVPTEDDNGDNKALFAKSLSELGLEVCTGPVVDFRVKDYWLQMPTADSIPLLYTHHFANRAFSYPKEHKKPNALRPDPEVTKWLMPNGCYVIVKRFSSKEEKRRVVAYIVSPEKITAPQIGFENHWNVLHSKKKGLDPEIAKGLACFLNTTALDTHFRRFSGHTQVNATDLRNMRYPTIKQLRLLGRKYRETMTQDEIDQLASVVQ